jgi:hypothetical protein
VHSSDSFVRLNFIFRVFFSYFQEIYGTVIYILRFLSVIIAIVRTRLTIIKFMIGKGSYSSDSTWTKGLDQRIRT